MILECMITGPLEVSCYIIGSSKTKEVAIVDPGGNVEDIVDTLNKNNFKPVYIMATHGHFDHIGGVTKLQEVIDCPFLISKDDLILVENLSEQASFFGFDVTDKPKVESFLKEGDILNIGDLKMDILETPGHTPGSLSFYVNNKVLVGDTVFKGSIGRTDLPGGSYETLINSVKEKLFTLKGETELYPGHGPYTTIQHEKTYNPFLNTLVL